MAISVTIRPNESAKLLVTQEQNDCCIVLSALMKVIDVWSAGGASPKGATEFDSVFLA